MKTIFLFRGDSSVNYNDFSKMMHEIMQEIKTKASPTSLWITLTEETPPVMTVIPFKKGKIAAISVVSDDFQSLEFLKNKKYFEGSYSADEAIPVSYQKTWNSGSVTPGICLLTLFRKKKNISYEKFLHQWHNSHTPLSLKIHPLWHYNRNVVKKISEEGNYTWDGIVEEHFRSRKDLLNIFRFFGNPFVVVQRMISVYIDTNAFLEYKTIEPWLVREYIYV